jgi:hypothetical protein
MSLSNFLESLLFYAPQSLQTLWIALVSLILSNAHARSSLLVHRVQPLLVLRQDVGLEMTQEQMKYFRNFKWILMAIDSTMLAGFVCRIILFESILRTRRRIFQKLKKVKDKSEQRSETGL